MRVKGDLTADSKYQKWNLGVFRVGLFSYSTDGWWLM